MGGGVGNLADYSAMLAKIAVRLALPLARSLHSCGMVQVQSQAIGTHRNVLCRMLRHCVVLDPCALSGFNLYVLSVVDVVCVCAA